jgi:hypothetical protein
VYRGLDQRTGPDHPADEDGLGLALGAAHVDGHQARRAFTVHRDAAAQVARGGAQVLLEGEHVSRT